MADEVLITLTADIVSAHLANNTVAVNDVSALISSVYSSLSNLGKEVKEEVVKPEPAVSIRSSVRPDYIVCLEDGKRLKMLKRHLMTHYNMTPEEYRAKWNLPFDYPMVASSYSDKRRELAVSIGLGQKRKSVAQAKAGRKRAVKQETQPV